jgi:hypothetical protein
MELLGLDDRLAGLFPSEDAAIEITDVGESQFDEGGGGFRAAAAAAAVNQHRLARIEFFRRTGGEIHLPLAIHRVDLEGIVEPLKGLGPL